MKNGVVWTGADGNTWVKDSKGTRSVGSSMGPVAYGTSLSAADVRGGDALTRYTYIQDPNAPAPAATPDPVYTPTVIGGGGGGASSAEARAAKEEQIRKDQARASIGATERNLAALDTNLNNRYGSIDSEYNNLLGQYSSEIGRHRTKYNDQVSSNEGTRDRNRHIGLVSAAQGGRGLAATLGSMGAYDESGSRLASRAAANVANQDIGEADRTFETNAKQLNTAWTDVEEDDRLRRQEAASARNSQRDNALYERDTQRAKLYQDIAGYQATLGDGAAASRYLADAGNINADAVARPRAAAMPFQARNVQYDAGQLANYLAGQNDMSVTAQAGAAAGAGPQLFANTRRRDREEELY